MFVITDYQEETEIVNGKTGERFSVFSIGIPEEIKETYGKMVINSFPLCGMTRLNHYSDGYLLIIANYIDYQPFYDLRRDVYYRLDKHGSYYGISDLSELGSFEDIRIDGQTFTVNDVGDYSEDVFYYSGAFYFRDGSVALDISDSGYIPYTKRDVYTPKFENGVCRMVAFKNDKFWIFDIDRNGEVITEVEEFDINLLNY